MIRFKLYKFEEIKAAANIQEHELVVDIGGGTGGFAQHICNNCKLIYVLDESEKMLSKLKPRKKLKIIKRNALKTPFENNSIDTVILSDVFHHIKEQKELVIEMNRILKPGGKLVMLDFDRKYIKTRLLIAFEFILFGKLFFRTKDEVNDLLKNYFYISKIHDKGYYFIIVGGKT